ncbi:hypothetical protein ACFYE2_00570 [Kocuria sp. CPCC 205300]|uniref:hypothetical protein n=1 Tax=Kocuria sabuli TaxID=3071448 RepID=UPI0036DA5D5E
MTDDNPSPDVRPDTQEKSVLWTRIWAWLGVCLGGLGFVFGVVVLVGFKPSEDAWLGFLGSLVAAGIGGLVAGLILRTQLKANGELQAEALTTQRDEARREREIATVSALIPFLHQERISDAGLFVEGDARRYTQLMLVWGMNSGLYPTDVERARMTLHSSLRLIAHARYRTNGARPVQDIEDALWRRRGHQPSTWWLAPSVLTDLRRHAGELIKSWASVPNMDEAEKIRHIEWMEQRLEELARKVGVAPHEVHPLDLPAA